MTKGFHFDPAREQYRCDAAVISCFDNRFQLGFSKFLKRLGIVASDPIKLAGGAKCLASPEHPIEREFVLEQIRKSIRLHETKLVILMLHSRRAGWRLRWGCPPGSPTPRGGLATRSRVFVEGDSRH